MSAGAAAHRDSASVVAVLLDGLTLIQGRFDSEGRVRCGSCELLSWLDRKLTLMPSRSGETLVLTFIDAGKPTKVARDGANHVITCQLG